MTLHPTHLDKKGQANMVDVGAKSITRRIALAEATLIMQPETLQMVVKNNARKGDVLAVARIAGIQAAKRTHELIPLCHAVALSSIQIDVEMLKKRKLHILATVICEAQTGVEMEALVAASVAALTVYDMLKSVDRGMEITRVRLLEKSGGRSGTWQRKKHPRRSGRRGS